ncbi:hypothetical protein Glove_186g86 [Diversispora epigaea]|uniref:Uncharacterized protein n=1 Tax=Diversispora epigaea TaxID=1348612 RepID=A0A397IRT4_9GLOM|nr:hypothetical protein Glove_186g86 [Diversispora epigaea]
MDTQQTDELTNQMSAIQATIEKAISLLNNLTKRMERVEQRLDIDTSTDNMQDYMEEGNVVGGGLSALGQLLLEMKPQKEILKLIWITIVNLQCAQIKSGRKTQRNNINMDTQQTDELTNQMSAIQATIEKAISLLNNLTKRMERVEQRLDIDTSTDNMQDYMEEGNVVGGGLSALGQLLLEMKPQKEILKLIWITIVNLQSVLVNLSMETMSAQLTNMTSKIQNVSSRQDNIERKQGSNRNIDNNNNNNDSRINILNNNNSNDIDNNFNRNRQTGHGIYAETKQYFNPNSRLARIEALLEEITGRLSALEDFVWNKAVADEEDGMYEMTDEEIEEDEAQQFNQTVDNGGSDMQNNTNILNALQQLMGRLDTIEKQVKIAPSTSVSASVRSNSKGNSDTTMDEASYERNHKIKYNNNNFNTKSYIIGQSFNIATHNVRGFNDPI